MTFLACPVAGTGALGPCIGNGNIAGIHTWPPLQPA